MTKTNPTKPVPNSARGTLPEQYRRMTGASQLQFDPEQYRVAGTLQQLIEDLDTYTPPSRRSLFRRLFGKQQASPKGLYIYGGVGSGKTMLMDLFYNALPLRQKQRKHFSVFMEDVHHAITQSRSQDNHQPHRGDPITTVAEQVSKQATVLCLDEFQVTDITDAMILGRLFEALFQRGLVLVTTGNTPLDGLYKNGINRELFLPFIDLIEDHTHLIALETGQDYRRLVLEDHDVWHILQDTGNNTGQDRNYLAQWQDMTAGLAVAPRSLTVNGRKLVVPLAAGKTARFTFDQLCAQPLGRADYLAIAHHYNTLFLDAIPVMNGNMRNEARRFTLLVDSLYDEGCLLIATAYAEPDALFIQNPVAGNNSPKEFERTASRLLEMRSRGYLLKHGS